MSKVFVGLIVSVGLLICSSLLRASDALPRATPESQGISSAALLDYIEAADQKIDAMNSFMLVRHGKVVAEGWWSPFDAQTPHTLFSLTKSFTSTAVGLAISEGKLNLDDQVTKFFPDDVPADASVNLKAMRVRDLLRMQSGQEKEAKLGPDEPWTKTFMATTVPFKPGSRFLYNTPGSYMLSAIVQKVTGMTEREYLMPRLFDKIGIDDPIWATSPQGVSTGGSGLTLHTEDIARFGILYLQKGKWDGKQVIPETWVKQATSLQTSNGSAPTSEWDQGYGYQFWMCRYNCYRGDGAHGQFCIVMPDQDAVVAITSGTRDMQSVMNLVWEKILPAMKAEALAEDAASQDKLKSRLASLQMKFVDGKSNSAVATKVSGKTYEFADNPKGIQSISFDFGASPAVTVKTKNGESHMAIGMGAWPKGHDGYMNGMAEGIGMPAHPLVAASGAWTAEDVFTIKAVAYETPFYNTMSFKFDGDKLVMNSENNVGNGERKQPELIGNAK